MKIRRIISTTAATAVLSTALLASPAVANEPDYDNAPRMLAPDRTILRGVDSWINIGVTSNAELQNVRIIVEEDKKGTEITYPSYGSSAGLALDVDLPAGGMDNAQVMLSTSGDSSDDFDLTVYATWEEDGRSYRAEIGEIEIELEEFDDDGDKEDYIFTSPSATVSSSVGGDDNWIDMVFLGIAPINSEFEIKVKKGIDDVYYPQDKYTSLHHDHRLDGGEEDIARVYVDPATVEPGTYTIEIEVKYTDNKGKNQKEKHEMTITVTE